MKVRRYIYGALCVVAAPVFLTACSYQIALDKPDRPGSRIIDVRVELVKQDDKYELKVSPEEVEVYRGDRIRWINETKLPIELRFNGKNRAPSQILARDHMRLTTKVGPPVSVRGAAPVGVHAYEVTVRIPNSTHVMLANRGYRANDGGDDLISGRDDTEIQAAPKIRVKRPTIQSSP